MSQMREIATINPNIKFDASEKLINTLKSDELLTNATKSDRNNNNVMKKSMSPPIPPKKQSKHFMAKNIDVVHDNRTNRTPKNGTSHNHGEAINLAHKPNAVTPTAREKLSHTSNVAGKNHGKGQYNKSNNLDGAVYANADIVSNFVDETSSDNNQKLNYDLAASTAALKSKNSGITHYCDNGINIIHLIRFKYIC